MILAAGGIGSRMGASTPKQYLPLSGKPIALHSFELFCEMDEIDEIIVVCDDEFRPLFSSTRKPILFAKPGKRRQDSIFNGLCAAFKNASIICTHDAARPFVERNEIRTLLEKTLEIGAATLASPAICTIKQCHEDRIVEKTLDRTKLWEIQTPQALRRDCLVQGFAYALANDIEVTDDTSLAELLHQPIAVVPSSRHNFKITTPDDLAIAQALCDTQCAIN